MWDNYFLRGDIFLYSTIVGVLSYLAPQLENGTFDECLQLLTHLPQVPNDNHNHYHYTLF